MSEIYVTKGKDDILTRTTLVVGCNTYIVESPYSDDDTLEMCMTCIEGYCASYGISKQDIASEMEKTINDSNLVPFNYIPDIAITMTVEQYDKRYITKMECNSHFNVISTLIGCFISVNIQTSWHNDSIVAWMKDYILINKKTEQSPSSSDDEEGNN